MPKQNFNEKLIALLKTNPDFLDESGELLPAAVKDHAWKLDHTLIRLLLSDREIKSTFGKFFRERGEVSLVWSYKDCVLEGGQTIEEEKRKPVCQR